MVSIGRTAVQADRLIPKSPFKETVLKKATAKNNISIQDIIKAIIKGDQKYHSDTKSFSKTFDFSKYSDFKQLWSIARNKIEYVKDAPGVEVIKSPSATWWSGTADCKSLSLFIGSVLRNSGVEYFYRFTHYGDPNNGHVYVVALNDDKNEIIMDAVHHSFDQELRYKYKVDYDPITEKSFGKVSLKGIHFNWKPVAIGALIAFILSRKFQTNGD